MDAAAPPPARRSRFSEIPPSSSTTVVPPVISSDQLPPDFPLTSSSSSSLPLVAAPISRKRRFQDAVPEIPPPPPPQVPGVWDDIILSEINLPQLPSPSAPLPIPFPRNMNTKLLPTRPLIGVLKFGSRVTTTTNAATSAATSAAAPKIPPKIALFADDDDADDTKIPQSRLKSILDDELITAGIDIIEEQKGAEEDIVHDDDDGDIMPQQQVLPHQDDILEVSWADIQRENNAREENAASAADITTLLPVEKKEEEEVELYRQQFLTSFGLTVSGTTNTLSLLTSNDGIVIPNNDSVATVSQQPQQPVTSAAFPTTTTTTTTLADDHDDDMALFDGEEFSEGISALDVMRAKLEKKELAPVDHTQIDYIPLRKKLYQEHPAVAALSDTEVASIRDDLEIKLRGRAPMPKPISTWDEAGLPDALLTLLTTIGYAAPFAIQRQALPIIMSGRDVIGVARTGSGKTIAYLLPMFRAILDQPRLAEGEGPIGLVLAPSRELVVQIHAEARRIARPLGLTATAIYGGAPVAEQIGALKRGGEIVVATPGRLIDMLTLNQGRLISFSRVSYVVLDEADRMFDMGFEPQISRILGVIRPDRQLVMFSATFPTHVEALARKALRHAPAEVVVGGRSKASPHIIQSVEVRDEASKFPRLLQLLGDWYERGGVLIFVDTQEHADALGSELRRAGYPAGVLHGGKGQEERDQTLADFKTGLRSLLVATSVAGRGLDVKGLLLVINYAAPNHLEDYVHRVGRTGRAGAPGTAVTFITPPEAAYASDLIRALKDAKQESAVSAPLKALADDHAAKVDAGTARKRQSGFTGSKGYKFDSSEASEAQVARRVGKAAFAVEAGEMPDNFDEDIQEEGGAGAGAGAAEVAPSIASFLPPTTAATIVSESDILREKTAENARIASLGVGSVGDAAAAAAVLSAAIAAANAVAAAANANAASSAVVDVLVVSDATKSMAAAAIAAIQRNLIGSGGNVGVATGALASSSITSGGGGGGGGGTGGGGGGGGGRTSDELDINEYPQQARFKVLKESVKRVEDWAGVSITSRGVYVQPGRAPPLGERRLHLFIEGIGEAVVKQAKTELRRVLEEETLRLGSSAVMSQMGVGKYSV